MITGTSVEERETMGQMGEEKNIWGYADVHSLVQITDL